MGGGGGRVTRKRHLGIINVIEDKNVQNTNDPYLPTASLPPELEKRPQADNLFFVQAKRFNSADAFSLHFPIKEF